ncbi:amidase [Conexibacter stalactiti]|uniref:Amidase n=1 Tax=Conexibacter stalactiti TaxID=1940611 RepID=A0ABU4HYM5_9ACTN|nr:amidase [Conexibacter stalactiti]MDW5598431.1 amidase [Conexibacter stalactiti]MEC5039073.1 amidase [Conexibacter stalactiti]
MSAVFDALPPAPTTTALAAAIRRGETTAVAAIEASLRAIEERNPALNAFVHVDADGALAAARAVDATLAAGGDPGPLAGVPFGVKDLDDCIGMPTGLGSLLFKDGAPAEREPPLVARLRAAGAIPVGKTATPEFGVSAATYSRAHGVTRNPWDPRLTPGGSSGGSAAAVAAGMVPFATGSDAGGSIRSPAAFCGLIGLKPSHGLIPGDRRIGPGQATDYHCWGVLTRTVEETALLLELVAGPYAPERASQLHAPAAWRVAAATLDVGGVRVGWSPDLGRALVQEEVRVTAEAASKRLAALAGGSWQALDVQLPDMRAVSWPRCPEMRSYLEAEQLYPQRAEELGHQVLEWIEARGTPTLALLDGALRARAQLDRVVAGMFAEVDVLATPTTACTAFPADHPDVREIDGRDASATGAEPFSGLANAAWLPSISVPAGRSAEGLPIGLQLTAPFGRDDLVLRLARLLERASA